GKPDLLINQFDGVDAGDSFVTVLLGNGDGTFQAPIHTIAGVDRFGLAVADFDGDGKLDFAVEELDNFFPGAADVFLGNGDGTFGDPHVFRTGGDAGFGVATGDFNGDGRPDLAVANTFSNDVRVLLNTSTGAVAALQQGGFGAPNVGSGTFGAFQYDPAGSAWAFSGPAGLAGNGSGFTSGNPNAPEGSQVAFLQGTGAFSQALNLAAGTYRLSFQAAQRGSFNQGGQDFQVL